MYEHGPGCACERCFDNHRARAAVATGGLPPADLPTLLGEFVEVLATSLSPPARVGLARLMLTVDHADPRA